MRRKRKSKSAPTADPHADPFGERVRRLRRRHYNVLGARFTFSSNSADLLTLADAAFARLPHHTMARRTRHMQVELRLEPANTLGRSSEPPPPRFHAAAGVVCASCDQANYAVVAPPLNSALVVLSRDMLRFPYHARYELIEFAVYTLATRSLGLVPVHAACVAVGDQALLLIGNSGAGKSTLAFHASRAGMELLAEDAAFIDSDRLLVAGVGNFLHLRPDSLRFVSPAMRRRLLRAPTITRRSGVSKLEIDLRKRVRKTRQRAIRLTAIVMLAVGTGRGLPTMTRLTHSGLRSMLRQSQPYARSQSTWHGFERQIPHIPGYQLQRGSHPAQSAALLASLLRQR